MHSVRRAMAGCLAPRDTGSPGGRQDYPWTLATPTNRLEGEYCSVSHVVSKLYLVGLF